MSDMNALPLEIFQCVVSLVNFEDVCHLRLVSRDISRKSTHGLVKSQYAPKTLILDNVDILEECALQTHSGWTGCLFRNLTIAGLWRMGAENKAPSPNSLELLTRIFRGVRTNSPHGCLESLNLLVAYERDGLICYDRLRACERVWWTSAWIFEITTAALSASRLRVKSFEMYSTQDSCSLAVNEFSRLSTHISPSLHILKHLSLNLSNRAQYSATLARETNVLTGALAGDAVCHFLEKCPSLVSLHLRWFRLGAHSMDTALEEDGGLLHHLLSVRCLGNLEVCRLRGTFTDEATLLALTQKLTRVRDLKLEEIHLTGNFLPILNYITREMAHVESLYLDDLFENRRHVHFAGKNPHYPTLGNNINRANNLSWPPTKGRNKGRRHDIKYKLTQRGPVGSPRYIGWRGRRRQQYGPP